MCTIYWKAIVYDQSIVTVSHVSRRKFSIDIDFYILLHF